MSVIVGIPDKQERRRAGEFPHVTDILKDAGLIDTAYFTEEMRERGTEVHKAAEAFDAGAFDEILLPPDVRPRVQQYQRFIREAAPEILSIEETVYNRPLRYCGRLDRRVIIGTREGVLDIKGPSRFPWQAIQLALYAACFPRPLARWTLHLSDDRYQLIEHKDRDDWNVAKAALTLASWKEKHGNGNG
jgi:hypothetical protein